MARKRVITLKGEKVLYVLIGLLIVLNVLGQSFSMDFWEHDRKNADETLMSSMNGAEKGFDGD